MNQKTKWQSPPWARRPLFRDKQRLTPDRLNILHEHHEERLRQVLLGLAGHGVVHGFSVETKEPDKCDDRGRTLNIGCGLAFDCKGRLLYWSGGNVGIDDLVGEKPTCDGDYTLFVHYAERRLRQSEHCGCDGDRADWIEEGVVFSLRQGCKKAGCGCPEICPCDQKPPLTEIPPPSTGQPPCQERPPNTDQAHTRESPQCPDPCCCPTHTDYICGRLGSDKTCIPVDPCLENLCREPGELFPVACDDRFYDPDSGIALACLKIWRKTSKCDPCSSHFEFCRDKPKVCEYRCFVHRNPLLYELILGCDVELPFVKCLSFQNWLKTEITCVPWNDFAEEITRGVEIHFSKPIKVKTLHHRSVILSAILLDENPFFQDVLRLPACVEHLCVTECDGEKYATGVRLKFGQDWLHHQICAFSRFNYGAIIELTIHSAMLRDSCNRMLNGKPLDIRDDDRSQRMPGVDFVVSFDVSRKIGVGQGGTH